MTYAVEDFAAIRRAMEDRTAKPLAFSALDALGSDEKVTIWSGGAPACHVAVWELRNFLGGFTEVEAELEEFSPEAPRARWEAAFSEMAWPGGHRHFRVRFRS